MGTEYDYGTTRPVCSKSVSDIDEDHRKKMYDFIENALCVTLRHITDPKKTCE